MINKYSEWKCYRYTNKVQVYKQLFFELFILCIVTYSSFSDFLFCLCFYLWYILSAELYFLLYLYYYLRFKQYHVISFFIITFISWINSSSLLIVPASFLFVAFSFKHNRLWSHSSIWCHPFFEYSQYKSIAVSTNTLSFKKFFQKCHLQPIICFTFHV